MQIIKELRIQEVRATRISNAPFQVVLEGNSFRREEKPSLTLDTETCAHYNIPMSLDLVGRTLVCFLESRKLPLKNSKYFKGVVDMESLKNDNLAIDSLEKSEVILPSLGMIPPAKHSKISRTLKLSSFGGGDSIHPNPLPCPLYHIVLELTDEEYEACKALPPATVFKINFHLA